MKRTINGLSPIHPGEYIREDSLPFVPRSSSPAV